MTRSSTDGGNQRVLFWLAWLVAWATGSLLIVGYWHRDNNYGLRQGDYRLRTIDSAQFGGALTLQQQAGWDHIQGTDKYVDITIKSPFVFAHVRNQILPMLLFALVALCSYLRWHGLPKQNRPFEQNRSPANVTTPPIG